MEPGHEDREYRELTSNGRYHWAASMEPGHEDREYTTSPNTPLHKREASMEPGHEDREYGAYPDGPGPTPHASMEPGHEDREYACAATIRHASTRPQWSPVMKTGNTRRHVITQHRLRVASMEPGHEDREYPDPPREAASPPERLNGARS